MTPRAVSSDSQPPGIATDGEGQCRRRSAWMAFPDPPPASANSSGPPPAADSEDGELGPSDSITGRDVELFVVGLASLLAGGVMVGSIDGPDGVVPPLVFVFLGTVSLVLAWWDVRSRQGALEPAD